MSTTSPRLITADEFYFMPEAPNGMKMELVRGEIVMAPMPGFDHGEAQSGIAFFLKLYARQTKRGRVTTETGVVTERDPDSVRGPDAAFWSAETIPLGQRLVKYPVAVPDLCVEVLSPSNRKKQVKEKIAEYLRSGVLLVWVIDPDQRTVTIHSEPGPGRLVREDEMLKDEEVLPGFECRVGEIFQ